MVHFPVIDTDLCARILGEYREMPGLRLSATQAARLWALEPAVCEAALERLVAEGRLARSARGQYSVHADAQRRSATISTKRGPAA